MPMNSIIRERRKALGLTQEQVAAYLGVSTPAVNKWEKEGCYPDITFLSPLARLLKIDLNTLFAFQDQLTEKEIYQFMEELFKVCQSKDLDAAFALADEKVQQYPACGSLLEATANMLHGAVIMQKRDSKDAEPYQKKITALYERAVECGNSQVEQRAAYILAGQYIQKEEFDKAQQMIDRIPDYSVLDKRTQQALLWEKTGKLKEAANTVERQIYSMVTNLQMILLRRISIAEEENDFDRAKEFAKVSKETAKLYEMWSYTAYVAPLEVASSSKNIEETLEVLEKIVTSIWEDWEAKDTQLYQSLSIRNGGLEVAKILLPTLLSELEKNPMYDFIREENRFQRLIERYREKCVRINK